MNYSMILQLISTWKNETSLKLINNEERKKKVGPIYPRAYVIIWASSRENLSSGCANNKGADQPAHPRSLISALLVRCLESIVSRLAKSEISICQLVPVVEQTIVSLTFSETPKTGFVARQCPSVKFVVELVIETFSKKTKKK